MRCHTISPQTAVVVLMAGMVALAADAFLGAAETLPAAVRVAMTPPAPRPDAAGGLNLMHVCFVPSDLIRGQQIALLVFLVGGIPAALLASALETGTRRRGRRWPAPWSTVFHGGLVFQVCCLWLTAFLLLLVVLVARTALVEPAAAASVGIFVLAIACDVWGLRSWRALQTFVRDDVPRIT